MTTSRIKLCGINNIDMASLNSVLQLSDSLRQRIESQ